MNHFLLEGGGGAEDLRYGAFAIEVLLNKMLRSGAEKPNVRAKAFGGSRMFDYGVNIGANNVRFTTAFLKNEGIPIVSSDFGGTHARRILFHPATGTARVSLVPREAMGAAPVQPARTKIGTITLFE